jgi:hypothetical protein
MCSVFIIDCVALRGAFVCVMCVSCVLYLIVVPLLRGELLFSIAIHNDIRHTFA